MATTSDYLNQLVTDKATLKANLEEKGVEVLDTDTFTEMSEKVADIPAGADLSEYIDVNASYDNASTISINISNNSFPIWLRCIKKIPPVTRHSGYTCKCMFALLPTEEVDLSGISSNNTTNFSYMFMYAYNLKNIDLSTLDFSNGTTFEYMFNNCQSLKTINFGDINTSNVTNMSNMFINCRAIENLDLSKFNTNKVTNMSYMFTSCIALKTLDIRNFDFTKVSSHTNMFGTASNVGVPDDCLIIVKDTTAQSWITSKFSRLTNVKTVAEYEAL